MSRTPWGLYCRESGEFHVVFRAFAGEDDGTLLESFPTRPEAKAAAAERARIAREEADRASGQRGLFG